VTFRIDGMNGPARAGTLATRHGDIKTPVFMPVGTHANVKACIPGEIEAAGAQVLLCNSYHLALRPGVSLIQKAGGLHSFMGWNGSILTDSGGYQLVSLAGISRISDEGAEFVSPYDGSRLFITPADAISNQANLGADIIMALDQPTGYGTVDGSAQDVADLRTIKWAKACRAAHPGNGHLVFGIAQGGFDEGRRRRSAAAISELDFDGVAIGGLALGEPVELMASLAQASIGTLPQDRPRYFMGLGTTAELIQMVGIGVDMFDCVVPTRPARHGVAMTAGGNLALRQARDREDLDPLEQGCSCPGCSLHFSRAYLRHLHVAREVLADRLLSIHNVTHLIRMIRLAREAILAGQLETFKRSALAGLNAGIDTPESLVSSLSWRYERAG